MTETTDIDWSDPTTCDEWIELPGTDGWHVARAHRTTVYAGTEVIEHEHASVEEASAEIALMVADHRRSGIEEALNEITETLATIMDEHVGNDTAVLESAWVHAVALGIRLGIYGNDATGFDLDTTSNPYIADRLLSLLDDCYDRGLWTEYASDLARAVRRAEQVRDLLPL